MGGTCTTPDGSDEYRVLVGNPERRNHFEDLEFDVKMKCEGVNWSSLIEERDMCMATVTNLAIP